ncbi:hypothetical protein DVA86_14745 [Streptomyces armeniacus]|uniref:ACP S-malonyltransferase n=1 Tax=Streptomyces armeniacus TaxID=83291 RepID=A0A345XQ10_9ACTN|nr:hypothetical protein [Streptomyces armeniacus]AXK33726.1 hypothetical protein DVA86_14745 [Streptomyces armeniacus]QIQ28648.1 Nbc52 [Streptomyces sp.]
MSLAFLCGTELLDDETREIRGAGGFHEQSPVMRYQYAKFASWAGVGVSALLDPATADGHRDRARAERVALTAAMLGIHDVLGVHGIRPAVLGGFGTGALAAGCLAGALPREELFALLLDGMGGMGGLEGTAGAEGADVTDVADVRDAPDVRQDGRGPGQARAVVFLPRDRDPEWYAALDPRRVRVGASLGTEPDGTCRVLLLTGDAEALTALAGEAPEGAVRLSGGHPAVLHSPLALTEHERAVQRLRRLEFRDPEPPVCSCLEPGTLTGAGEVRDLFGRCVAEPADIGALVSGLAEQGTRLALVLGPSLPRHVIDFPFPVVHVDAPERVADAIASLLEYGVGVPTPG